MTNLDFFDLVGTDVERRTCPTCGYDGPLSWIDPETFSPGAIICDHAVPEGDSHMAYFNVPVCGRIIPPDLLTEWKRCQDWING